MMHPPPSHTQYKMVIASPLVISGYITASKQEVSDDEEDNDENDDNDEDNAL